MIERNIQKMDALCNSQNCFNDKPINELLLSGRYNNVIFNAFIEIDKNFNKQLIKYGLNDICGQVVYNKLKTEIISTEKSFQSFLNVYECSTKDTLKFIIEYTLDKLILIRTGFFLKQNVAKKMLIKYPPTNLIKYLSYDNVFELIDKEDIYEIFSLLRISETTEWTNNFIDNYKFLNCADFEERLITYRILDYEKFPFVIDVLKQKQTIWEDKIMGTIFGIPFLDEINCKVPILRILTRTAHYLNELYYHSKFVKYIGENKLLFGNRLSEVLKGNFSEYNFFEPHCLSENLYWIKTHEFIMSHIRYVPELEYWKRNYKVGGFLRSFSREEIVSLNLLDVLTNVSKDKEFPGNYRILSMAIKGNLFDLLCRDKKNADNIIIKNLDSGFIRI